MTSSPTLTRLRPLMAAGLALAPLVFTAATAQAALPPYWQRAAEIKAILEDGDVANALKDEPVDAVEWSSDDLYKVRAGVCTLDVRIVSDPQDMPGPRKFHLEIGKPGCR